MFDFTRGLRPILMAGVAVSAIASLPVALAQVDEQAASEGVEEIVVTAEKRKTQLQKTPSAITALSSRRLETQGITGVEQLQFNVPALTFGQNSGYSYLTLRGIGSDVVGVAGEPSVATYLDNVYTGSSMSQNLPEFDLERVEVLRGPQGTLYGRNAIGGVINYITKAPSYENSANVSAVVGTYGRFGIGAGVTGPIVEDKLAVRASFNIEERDGYRENLALGIDEDDLEMWSGRAALLWEPTENLSITLRGDYTSQESSNPYALLSYQGVTFGTKQPDPFTTPETPLGLFSQPASVLATIPGLLSPEDLASLNGGSIAQRFGFIEPNGPPPPDPERTTDVSNAYPTLFESESGGTSLAFDADFDGINFKSITAFRYARLNIHNNSAGTAVPGPLLLPVLQDSNQWTQEFNLSGTAFDDKMDWLIGAYYFHDKSRQRSTVFLPNFGDYLTALFSFQNRTPGHPYAFNLSQPVLTLFQVPIIESTVVVSGPNYGGGTAIEDVTIPETAFVGFRIAQEAQSFAGFAQGTYEINERLRVTAGLRYTIDEKNVVRSLHGNLVTQLNVLFGAPANTGLCHNATAGKKWYAMTGTAGIDYDVAERTMIYGKYSRGYKAGGFNAGECAGGFDPEYLSSYEVGVKSIFGEGQYSVSAAAFFYEYDDIQFTTYVANSGFIRNASSAELYGLELEFQAVPDALAGLMIDGSFSYVHSEYGDGVFSDVSRLYTANIGGNELIRSPEWRFSLGAQYAFDLGETGELTLRGEAAWTDTIYNDIFNGEATYQGEVTQPAYWLLNARLIWEIEDGKYQIQAFGENLTDELYATNRVSFNTPATFINVAGQFAAPRTFGLRFTARFDGF